MNPSTFRLDGRVAVITGGNGGIGRAIAMGMARAGASIAVLARNDQKNARVLQELQELGAQAVAVQLDVTQRNALDRAMQEAQSALGPIDILVNNAGTGVVSGGILTENPDAWDVTIDTHLNATFLLSKIAARSMAQRKRGKIINIASLYSFFGAGAMPSYSAAKGAVVQLTKSMAIELAPHNIQVNAIAPGWIATDLTAAVRENPAWSDFNQMTLARTPADRWGTADDVAGPAVFFASDAAAFVTGTTLPVDGGYAVF